MRIVLLMQLMLILNLTVHSQSTIYFGIEGAIANDLYSMDDPGDNLKITPLKNVVGGICVRKELSPTVFYEIGIIYKSYHQGIEPKKFNLFGYSYSNAFNSILLPVKLGYRIKLTDKIFIAPSAGFSVGINVQKYLASGGSWGTYRSATTTIEFSYTENDAVSRLFLIAQPSIGIERRFFDVLLISIRGSRSFGFIKAHQLDITYSVDDAPQINAQAINRGDYWSLGLCVKYPLYNSLKKNKYHSSPRS